MWVKSGLRMRGSESGWRAIACFAHVFHSLNLNSVVIYAIQDDVPAVREWYEELSVLGLVFGQWATPEGEFAKFRG